MRVRYHDRAVAQLLRQPAAARLSPARRRPQYLYSVSRRRGYATDNTVFGPLRNETSPQNIAVIGGGITGLTTAYLLRKQGHKVTIYSDGKLGGWINSEYQEVDGGGRVLFEGGPRTLRPTQPNGVITAMLVEDLNLSDDLIVVKKTAPGAKSRWIYYPDHLVQMPGGGQGFLATVWSLLTEPVFANALFSSWSKLLTARDPAIEDQSIGKLISRRISEDFANNIPSAVMHGIYAGNIWRLSADALLPALWFVDASQAPAGENFAMLRTMYREEDGDLMQKFLRKPPITPQLAMRLNGASFFTFTEGLGMLSDRMVDKLKQDEGVTIVEEACSGIRMSEKGQQVEVQRGFKSIESFDQVISTISAQNFHACAELQSDEFTQQYGDWPESVDVGVVNLYFENPDLLPVQGFGYLIPQSIPFEQNPERALGVIFDSCAVQGQDSVEGTKVTVMMGGHWWDGWNELPDNEQLESMAKSLLKRHLGIKESPTLIRAVLQKNCIPQYEVGHRQRLAGLHSKIMRNFKGRVKVAGSSYHGVGVNDCIRSAYDVCDAVGGDDWASASGLNRFAGPQLWAKLELKPPREVKEEDIR